MECKFSRKWKFQEAAFNRIWFNPVLHANPITYVERFN